MPQDTQLGLFHECYEELKNTLNAALSRSSSGDERNRLVAQALTELKRDHPDHYPYLLRLVVVGPKLLDEANEENEDPEKIAESGIVGAHLIRAFLKDSLGKLGERK